uniref:PDZ domain-containing protein n=1 Tax=Ciona savignyi TaxID=51511 RepID=H2ZJN1_CIOSA
MSRINENLVDADSNGTFKRSFSLPAVRRKKVTNNHSLTTNDENAHGLENGNAQHNRVWLRTNRAVSGRKGEIRVSRFNPVGIDLPLDLLTQIKQSETRNNIKNGGHPQTTMPQKPIRAAEKVEKRKDNNGFVKKLNSVCRIRSFTNKDIRTCCIKNVEIHRNPNETLGIFIKKRKISRGTHFSVFPDGTRCKEGIFISRLAPKCKAVDLVNPGDQLLAINSIEVSHLGVKIVAALMAMPSLLALTIKTPHANENGHVVSTSSI